VPIKRISICLLVIFILTILVSGCQSSQKKPLEDIQDTRQEDESGMTASGRRILADRLSSISESVEGVKKATVVISDISVAENSGQDNDLLKTGTSEDQIVNGMIVMVGITVTEQADKEKTKKAVKEKLKATDSSISQVLVTTDAELVKKINEVATGVIEGQAITKFEEDIKEIGKELKNNTPAF